MVAGLLIGFVLGLLMGPILRSWLLWREYAEASHEARLHEEALRRMGVPPSPDETGPSDRDRSPPITSR